MDLSDSEKVKEQNSCAQSVDWEQSTLELFKKFLSCESSYTQFNEYMFCMAFSFKMIESVFLLCDSAITIIHKNIFVVLCCHSGAAKCVFLGNTEGVKSVPGLF